MLCLVLPLWSHLKTVLSLNRWVFIIVTAANLVTKWGGVVILITFFTFFLSIATNSQALQLQSCKHSEEDAQNRVLQSQYCQGTKQLHRNSHSPGRQLTQLELLQPPQLRGGREGECKQHMCMVQMLTLMVCHLSRNPSSSEISAETPGC